MLISLIGLNQNTAPVVLRERLFFGAAAQVALLAEIIHIPTIDEAVALSTCNRTEILLHGENTAAIVSLLARHAQMDESELRPHLYLYTQSAALTHLFRVACGLDSQIIGEMQILKQLRDALKVAQEQHVSGRFLLAVLQQAIATGKRVRTETAISQGSFSIGQAGVELARTLFPNLQDSPVLILGAGKISELTARHLADSGVKSIIVANRTYAHALELAKRLGGQAMHYSALESLLSEVDILISSTSAPHYVLHVAEISRVMLTRGDRPLCLIDLAVPRDIEPVCGDIPGVRLFNIDNLQGVTENNAAIRRSEIPQVERIIAEDVERCHTRLMGLEEVALIVALREHFDDIRQAELTRNASLLATMTVEQRESVEEMTMALVNKLLHIPTVRLKQLMASNPEQHPEELLRDLFNLETAKIVELGAN